MSFNAQIPIFMHSEIFGIEATPPALSLVIAEIAAKSRQIMIQINMRSDRLINSVDLRSPVLPMGGW